MTRRSIYLAVATAALATVARCEEMRWFNLEVNEPRRDTEVRLHLPMSLVVAALDVVDTKDLHHGKVHFCSHSSEIDWPAVLRQIRSAPEGQPVTVKSDDADLLVTRVGPIVKMRVDEHGTEGERLELSIEADLLDALTINSDSTVDVKALVARLGNTRGEVLKVESHDAHVRIWVE